MMVLVRAPRRWVVRCFGCAFVSHRVSLACCLIGIVRYHGKSFTRKRYLE